MQSSGLRVKPESRNKAFQRAGPELWACSTFRTGEPYKSQEVCLVENLDVRSSYMLGPAPTHEQSIIGVIFKARGNHIIQLVVSGGSTQATRLNGKLAAWSSKLLFKRV